MDSDICQHETLSYVISIIIKHLLYQWIANDIVTFVGHSERSEESRG